MDASFDLPDSTDWLSTSLPVFEPLEAALRCEVCKEFLSNPVITSCSHTFCSICIRRCIATDGRCPSCKTGCSSDKLAPNIAVREVVMRFTEARPKALEMARADKQQDATMHSAKKRKIDETDIEEDENVRHTRSRRMRNSNRVSTGLEDAPIEVADSEGDDDDFVPEGMAKCPICAKSMKAEQVFNHLDVCTGPEPSQGRTTRSKNKSAYPAPLQRRQKEPSPPPSRLSQLNYAMLKEGAFRKKLQDLGIPNWGSKDLMKRRHIEWLNIYNSNCDAHDSERKSKRQLLKELSEWEETQGGRADTKESKIMKKDFDGDGYMKSHKSDFDDLIARARQKRSAPKSDEAADTNKLEDTLQSDAEHVKDTSNQDTDPPTTNGTTHAPYPPSEIQAMKEYQPRPLTAQHPYENNESALASIRAKVQAANEGLPQLPTLKMEPSLESARRRNSTTAEGMQNPLGSPSRKLPMFTLPTSPVKDVDNSSAIQ
ncbi:E3 ubiquitin-protein ligase rad18 [Coniothyrium glycines]